MTFDQLRAALLQVHMAVQQPSDSPPDGGGWYVVVSPSDYHPEGWSIRLSHPHRIIGGAVVRAFEAVGFEVQRGSDFDARMEAWPKTWTYPLNRDTWTNEQ
jgi:hypothetical protein